MRIEAYLFGANIHYYQFLNVMVHAGCGLFVCLMAQKMCHSWFASVILAMIAVTARFGFYEVTRITGQVESLSLFLCLASVYSLMRGEAALDRADDAWPSSWKWLSLAFAFLAFNAHERYIVMMPWLACFFVFGRRGGSLRQRSHVACVIAVMILSNFLVKKFLFHATFFQGTDNKALGLNFHSIVDLSAQATLTIFGVSHGPQYLVGAEWTDFSTVVKGISIVCISIETFLFVIACVGKRTGAESSRIHWPFSLASLIVLLLIPAVLTIRMEQRWELGPFMLLLVILAGGLSRLTLLCRSKAIATALLICLISSIAAIEVRVSHSFSSIFFTYDTHFADSVKKSIIDARGSAPGTALVFIAIPGNCISTLLDGGFFQIYEGKFRSITCVDSIQAADPRAFPSQTRMYVSETPDRLVDVTAQWKSKQTKLIPAAVGREERAQGRMLDKN